jgi:hypothetical protein
VAAFAAALSLAGCQKDDLPQGDRRIDHSNLKFEIHVGAKADYGGGGAETRAVKPGWAPNDRIVVYFDGSRDNEIWLTYDEQQGWVQDGNGGITSLEPSGSAQALHAMELHSTGSEVDKRLMANGDLLFTDTGGYTFDGQTVRLTLDMTDRITSRITVEGLADPYVWGLAGPDLSVANYSEPLFEGSFDQALRTFFEPSGINRAIANGYVKEYHDAGSASFFVLDRDASPGTAFVLRNHSNGKVYTRTYSERELEPGKAVVIQGPEGEEAGLWADMSASVNALQSLIDEAYGIHYDNYTWQSIEAVVEAREEAEELLGGASFTEGQLAVARNTLRAALDALVALPHRPVAGIGFYPSPVDGFIWLTPGRYQYLNAYAEDAGGGRATNPAVTFEFTEPVWMEDVYRGETSLGAFITESAPAGATVTITIKAVDNPSVSTQVTLKVAAEGELKAMFLTAVAALPDPARITYSDRAALEAASDLKDMLHESAWEDPAIMAAIVKLEACGEAYENLPTRLQYSFSGNTATVTPVDYDDGAMIFDYAQNGGFPNGTYTSGWEQEDGYYSQFRLELNSDGTFTTGFRGASDQNGTDATPWEQESHGTYTNDGTQAGGGTLYLTYVEDDAGDGRPSPDPVGRAFAAASAKSPPPTGTHRLFGK